MLRHLREAAWQLLRTDTWHGELGRVLVESRIEYVNPPAGGTWALSWDEVRRADGDEIHLLQLRTAPRPRQVPAIHGIHRNDFAQWMRQKQRHLWPDEGAPLWLWVPELKTAPTKPQHPSEVLGEWDNEYKAKGTKRKADRGIAERYGFTVDAVEKARKRRDTAARLAQADELRRTGAWTSPRAVDNPAPHKAACSKASGLTPPRWL
nr:hypothetical protein [Sinimarinibacterium sp. CAU 1509]